MREKRRSRCYPVFTFSYYSALFSEIGFCVASCSYVIVIVRLVCDMAQTQHDRGPRARMLCLWPYRTLSAL